MEYDFPIEVDRLCRIRADAGQSSEEQFPLDEDGFLHAEAARESVASLTVAPGRLVHPRVVVEQGAIVLLGEPGIGKTTVFRMLAQAAGRTGPGYHWVDCADLSDGTYREYLGERLEALPPLSVASTDAHEEEAPQLVVVLDQLDESPLLRRLAGRLRSSLAGRDTSRLRLLVGCRTADFPADLEQAITETCGDCVLADLAPLTRAQAEQLLSSIEELDGPAVIAAATNAGAGALASVPLTLRLIASLYERSGKLEGRPTDLFGRSVEALLDERVESTRNSLETSVEQRAAIAERIAAFLLVTGRRTLWSGSQLGAGPQYLAVGSIVGGDELLESGAKFEVTAPRVRETLRRAIFTGRGPERMGFRHSSIGAFLAARYLVRRKVPAEQLRALFLSSSSAAGIASVPSGLAETAAWLVTLEPDHAKWLVTADPRSLISYSAIVDSPEARSTLVGSLIQRAPEIELTSYPWLLTRRDLTHPELSGQLLEVLGPIGSDEPDDWETAARVRVAIRLAGSAATGTLVDPLLEIASSRGWSPWVRRLAVEAVSELARDEVEERLLAILDDVAHADAEVDPDDELRGELLQQLWPGSLTIEQVAGYLTPQRNTNLIGSYLMFQRELVNEAPDEAMRVLLQEVAQSFSLGPGVGHDDASEPDRPTSSVDQLDDEELGHVGRRFDEAFVDGVVERVMLQPEAAELLDDIARVLLVKLRRYDRPAIPKALCLVDEAGSELESAVGLRRDLVLAMASAVASAEGGRRRRDLMNLIGGWGATVSSWPVVADDLVAAGEVGERRNIFDSRDVEWGLRESARLRKEGRVAMSDALAELTASVVDRGDPMSWGQVYGLDEHPIWPYVEWMFEPISTDSDLAVRWRERQQADRHPDAPPAGWVLEQIESLIDVVEQDQPEDFWKLAWNLQADVETGMFTREHHDDLMGFRAVGELTKTRRDQVERAAERFLAVEHDHAGDWLGTKTWDKRAWAGYLAIAHLVRRDGASELDVSWADWAGAVVDFSTVAVESGDRGLKESIVAEVASHCPDLLAERIMTYARRHLAVGRHAFELEGLKPDSCPEVQSALQDLVGEILAAVVADERNPADVESDPPNVLLSDKSDAVADALRLVHTLAKKLDPVAPSSARELLLPCLGTLSTDSQRVRAVACANTLMSVAPREFWNDVKTLVAGDESVSLDVALAVASKYDGPDLRTMDEQQLAEMYRWLAAHFAPDGDTFASGFVSAEEQARETRRRLLTEIGGRGTAEAVAALGQLAEEFPAQLQVRAALVNARTSAAEVGWVPPEPAELARLILDTARRLVRSELELLQLVMEMLEEVARDLSNHCDLLWDYRPAASNDEEAVETWRPKTEAAVSSYLAHELALRLHKRGLAVNREVLVRPTDAKGAGDRTDILIEARLRSDEVQDFVAAALKVVIEVKCPWNRTLKTAMRSQLLEQYLEETGSRSGVYLVPWFPTDAWDSADYRKGRVRNFTLPGLAAELAKQAEELTAASEATLSSFCLTVEHPWSRRDDG